MNITEKEINLDAQPIEKSDLFMGTERTDQEIREDLIKIVCIGTGNYEWGADYMIEFADRLFRYVKTGKVKQEK